MNDLSCTSSSIHAVADDAILHYHTRFEQRPNQKGLQHSRDEAMVFLSSDLAAITQ